jgi:hypothetical protein
VGVIFLSGRRFGLASELPTDEFFEAGPCARMVGSGAFELDPLLQQIALRQQ